MSEAFLNMADCCCLTVEKNTCNKYSLLLLFTQDRLRHEIVALQDDVTHPPALVRLKAETESLRCQLNYVKATMSHAALDQQRSGQLLDIYLKLEAELDPSESAKIEILKCKPTVF